MRAVSACTSPRPQVPPPLRAGTATLTGLLPRRRPTPDKHQRADVRAPLPLHRSLSESRGLASPTCSCWCNGRSGDRRVSTWLAPAPQYTLPCCCPRETQARVHEATHWRPRLCRHRKTPGHTAKACPALLSLRARALQGPGFHVYKPGRNCPVHLTACRKAPGMNDRSGFWCLRQSAFTHTAHRIT